MYCIVRKHPLLWKRSSCYRPVTSACFDEIPIIALCKLDFHIRILGEHSDFALMESSGPRVGVSDHRTPMMFTDAIVLICFEGVVVGISTLGVCASNIAGYARTYPQRAFAGNPRKAESNTYGRALQVARSQIDVRPWVWIRIGKLALSCLRENSVENSVVNYDKGCISNRFYWLSGTDYSALRASPCGSPSQGLRAINLACGQVVEPSFCLSAVRIGADSLGNAFAV